MVKSKELIKKIPIDFIFLTGILFIINIRDLSELSSPAILFDEIGYWASGALFTGNDWSSVMSSLTAYYAYGYGFILALIMLLTESQVVAYKVAIIINAMMICCTFFLNYYLLIKVFNTTNNKSAMVVSFITQFYISLPFNSQIAWTEILLSFLFNIIVIVIYKIIADNSLIWDVILAILSIYLFMVHMRTLGVLICIVILRIFWGIFRKETKLNIMIFCLVLLGGCILHNMLSNYVTCNIWKNFTPETETVLKNAQGNNFSRQFDKILYLFSPSGLSTFVFLFLGRFFYLGISTFGIAYKMLFEGIKKIIVAIREKKYDGNILIFIFIISSLVATWSISSVFMIFRGRLDLIIYSRYSDWIIQPILAIGLFYFYEGKNNVKIAKGFFYTGIFILFYCILFQGYVDMNKEQAFFGSCSPYGFYFYRNGDVSNWVYYMGIFSCLVMISFLLISLINRKSIKLFILFLICIIWLRLADFTLQPEYGNACRDEVKRVSEILEQEEKIYYVIPQGTREQQLIGAIQFCIKDKKVNCIFNNKKEELEEGIVIVSKKDEKTIKEFEKNQLVDITDYYNLYKIE